MIGEKKMDKYGRKAVLVTGGAKGIGHSISVKLAEAGYDVVVNYHNRPKEAEKTLEEIRSFGVEGCMIYADMSNLDDIKKMYDEAYAEMGELYAVVNNAGVGVEKYFFDTTEEDFNFMVNVDFKGVYFSTQFAAKKMVEKGTAGLIINVTSNQAVGNWPRSTVYGPTKAAVSKFTQNAAMELALKNIRVNNIAPGYTDAGWEPGDHRFAAAPLLPLKRFASMDEIGASVVYMCSDAASYMTGATLTLDGGALLPVVACNDFVKND